MHSADLNDENSCLSIYMCHFLALCDAQPSFIFIYIIYLLIHESTHKTNSQQQISFNIMVTHCICLSTLIFLVISAAAGQERDDAQNDTCQGWFCCCGYFS